MDLFLFVRYLHFVGIFLVVSGLVFEISMVKSSMSRKEIGLVSRLDGIYGMGAVLVLSMGLWMWLGDIGKPPEFYTANWIFHSKLTLFIVVGLLSIYPTLFFLRERTGDAHEVIEVPGTIRKLIYLEVILIFLIPLLAVLMARGVGSF